MKKILVLVLAALCLTLTACGGGEETKDVDLTALTDTVMADCGWEEGYLVDIEGEMLEMYYPGLAEIPATQFVAKMPMMSAVVNEFVFMQCETEEDAAKAAEILQERITMQAEGGAWYPESIAAWEKGQVVQQGTYVAMVASAEFQDAIVEAFNQSFQ